MGLTKYDILGAAVSTVGANFVATLPGTPIDGQEIFYQSAAMATDGIIWQFRYRSASASAYKWEFVGGPAWSAPVDTVESLTSNAYAAVATPGPTVTPPLAGDYMVEINTRYTNSAAGAICGMSYAIGAATALADDAVLNTPSSANQTFVCASRIRRKNALAAAVSLVSQYRSDGVNTATFMSRLIAITPIRVG